LSAKALSAARDEKYRNYSLFTGTGVKYGIMLVVRFYRVFLNRLSTWVPFPRIVAARLRRHRFAQIVPLGVNCETAFRFYRRWGFVDSSLAAWAQLYDLDTTVRMLRDLNAVMAGPATFEPSSKMWKCGNCGVKFHGKLKYGRADTPEEIAADLADLKSRVAHLREKLVRYAVHDSETLFAHRLSERDEREPNRLGARLDALEDALVRLGARNWKLLVICETAYAAALPQGAHRVFRTVRQFNPTDNVTNPDLGDGIGWQAIFTEFAPAKIQPKKHAFKFE